MRKLFSGVCLILAVFFMGGCDKPSSQEAHSKAHDMPITGKIIFESTREALKDQLEVEGRKYGQRSSFLLEKGILRKIYTGCRHPRWSADGENILCVKDLTGELIVINKEGGLLKSIEPKNYALFADWYDGQIVYVGEERKEGAGRKIMLNTYGLPTGKERTLYATKEGGQILGLNWDRSKEMFIFELYDSIGVTRKSTYVVALNPKNKELSVFLQYAYTPVVVNDGKTLVVATNRYPNGDKIFDDKWGALAKYNIETKEFEVIRPSGWIRSMRLSPDGKHLLIAETSERKGVKISVYSIDNLVTPIYQIPTTTIRHGEDSQDLNPDWIY